MDHLARINVFNYGALSPAERALKSFSIFMYVFSSTISLCAFCYGLFIGHHKPSIWRSSIFRVLMVAQVLNFVRFILRPVTTYIKIHSGFGCRALLFFNNATTILPVNLCIYCVIYLQLVVFHKVSPAKRWPRALLLTMSVAVSVIPISMYLFLSPSLAGVDSFCNLKKIPDRKQYVFIICVLAIWEYLAGAIGVVCILVLVFRIAITRRETKRALHASAQYYGPSGSVQRNTNPELLNQTLRSIIWFPITPIISLYLNILLLTISYYTREDHLSLEFINVVLLALQSYFLAIALVLNPSVRCAYAEQGKRRRSEKEKSAARATVTYTEHWANRRQSRGASSFSLSLESMISDSQAWSPAV
ncbi:hypothetical protein IWW38_002317 [Coemansia aciculifera]|uniref:Uncharacterized protein n=1 Tax=Coemansia aciculifera TaxID=417176 RepID=A0ACC1M4X0_9FUNG|nr:hypothetical protein IWW38_002317 [Coemansia aciculifera]